MSGDNCLTGSGSTWERAPTTHWLRPSRGSYLMDPAPFLIVVEVGTSMSLL